MTTEQFILENSLENEVWKPINGFENLYMISSFGRILSCDKQVNNRFQNVQKDAHLLKWNTSGNTPAIILSDSGKSSKKHIAKLVAEHFLDLPTPEQVVLDYRDNNKLNCNADNLFWRTPKYKQRKKFPPIEDLEGEIWKPVPVEEFKDSYQVSNFGRVKSLERKVLRLNDSFHVQEKILKPRATNGYLIISLGQNNKQYIHKLVALAFIPNPDNLPQIDHINTIRTDNRVENLHWVTATENMNNELTKKHISDKTKAYYENNKFNPPVAQYSKDNVLISTYSSIDEAAQNEFTRRGILDCLKGTYKSHKGFIWKINYDQIDPPLLNA